jgi:hypothetical protein
MIYLKELIVILTNHNNHKDQRSILFESRHPGPLPPFFIRFAFDKSERQMKKLSGEYNFLYKYMFPFAYGGVFWGMSWMLWAPLAIQIPAFIIPFSIVFLSFQRISDLFIDYDNKEFCIINGRKQYRFGFSELKRVEPLFYINIVKLKFENRSVLFCPSGIEFPQYKNTRIINELREIARSHRYK